MREEVAMKINLPESRVQVSQFSFLFLVFIPLELEAAITRFIVYGPVLSLNQWQNDIIGVRSRDQLFLETKTFSCNLFT